jgi:hypothetical protein
MLNYAPLLPYFDQPKIVETWLESVTMPNGDDKSLLLLDESSVISPTGKTLFTRVLTHDLTVNGYVVETLNGHPSYLTNAVRFLFDRRGLTREASLTAAQRVTLFVVDDLRLHDTTALAPLFDRLPNARLLVVAYGDLDALTPVQRRWIDRYFHVARITSPDIIPLLQQRLPRRGKAILTPKMMITSNRPIPNPA